MTAVFHGLPIQATGTILQYAGELMNYSGSYANRTMKQDTAHVFESVFGLPGVFLWECESPLRWELGNLLTLVLCSSQSKEKKKRVGVVVNKMLQQQTTQEQIWGVEEGEGRGKNTTAGVGGRCGNKPPQSNSVIRIQHADT